MAGEAEIQEGIGRLVEELFPGAQVKSLTLLRPGTVEGAASKAEGYGVPMKLELSMPDGELRRLVLHTQSANEFGHDRRADRAEACVLAFDTFGHIPGHVRAVDVGAVGAGHRLVSLRASGEFYLLTDYAEGRPYSEDLRRIGQEYRATPLDVERMEALADFLAALHANRLQGPARYRRAIRDLVGHGEGIFGMVDGYPDEVPGASSERLQSVERLCVEWRWRLRHYEQRLVRTHGDFHPFNLIFADGASFTALDASRGCAGDAADDVIALAINYVFFALDSPGSWEHALGSLWSGLWERYLDRSGDLQLLEVAAPFLAWRCLVVCNPRFYPQFSAEGRARLLGWVEKVLRAKRFDPACAKELFQ